MSLGLSGDLGEVERRLRALRTQAGEMQNALDMPLRALSPPSGGAAWAAPRSPGTPIAGLDPNAPDFLSRLADLKAQHARNLRELELQLQRGGRDTRAHRPVAPRPRSAGARERPHFDAADASRRAAELDELIAATRARRGLDTSRLDAARQRWQHRPHSAPHRRPRPRTTVPQPFEFEGRDAEQRRLSRERAARERRHSEGEEHYQPFKAQPVPISTVEPRYERMVARAERRREEIVAERRANLQAGAKPFSFHDRPPVPRRRPPAKTADELALKHTFRAKPVPPFVSMRVYEQMQHDGALRKERISRAAHELLAHASLPPRMELYRQMGKVNKVAAHVRAR